MFQRRSGAMQRLRPAPTKNTTIEMVNVRKPGVSKVVVMACWRRLLEFEVCLLPSYLRLDALLAPCRRQNGLIATRLPDSKTRYVQRRQKDQREHRRHQQTAHDRESHWAPEYGR